MPKRTIESMAVSGRRVLIRTDFNVPLDEKQHITDDRRIRESLPTIRHVVDGGGRAILVSHLGRPSGQPAEDAKFSLRPTAVRLGELLGRPVAFAPDCVGPQAAAAVAALRDGDALVLENLRFHPAETIIDLRKKNPDGKLSAEQNATRTEFARGLAAHADLYVNNAFGTCHRKHVSMYDVPERLGPGRRVIGSLVAKELQYLGDALARPARPFVAILGGAKVSDKIGVIRSLLKSADHVLIGGAMTFTFWAAQGIAIGRSRCEREKLELARQLLSEARDKLHLPTDSVAASELRAGVSTRVVRGALPDDLMGLDIGPESLAMYRETLGRARTIFWNGPVGAFETPPFEAGTFAVARMIAEATRGGAVSVIGGGDSAAAIDAAGLSDAVTHISTGGGASLEYLEKGRFETIDLLDDA